MIRNSVLAAVLALVTVAIPKASASTPPVFDLNNIFCNCLTAGSSNGGTVTLANIGSGTGGAGEVSFDVVLASPLNFHNTNAFDAFAFSYIASTGTAAIGNLTVSGLTSGFTASTTPQGSGSMDGAGMSFNEFIDTSLTGTGGNTGVTELKFNVSGTGITVANFEVLNGNTVDFAAAVSSTTTSGCTGVIGGGSGTSESTAKASTGSASGVNCGSTTQVPEPTSVLLLGTALLFAGKILKMKLLVS